MLYITITHYIIKNSSTYPSIHPSVHPFIGFLSTGDSNAPGNYALLDLVAGLHWVKENIQAFGGDPNNICLFGHRYGAVLVNLLMVSPLTKGKNMGFFEFQFKP